MKKQAILAMAAVLAIGLATGVSSPVSAEEKTCRERQYEACRKDGLSHAECKERAKEICDKPIKETPSKK